MQTLPRNDRASWVCGLYVCMYIHNKQVVVVLVRLPKQAGRNKQARCASNARVLERRVGPLRLVGASYLLEGTQSMEYQIHAANGQRPTSNGSLGTSTVYNDFRFRRHPCHPASVDDESPFEYSVGSRVRQSKLFVSESIMRLIHQNSRICESANPVRQHRHVLLTL